MILNGPGISYTEPDIGAEFVPPLPEHPREAIVKLCEHCTNRLLHRDELLGYIDHPERSPLREGWRFELVGSLLDDLLAGDIGLTVKDGAVEIL
mgnify:CR=1 FL=1